MRQIAITDLGHEKPTLLLTKQMKGSAAHRYAGHMIIENTLANVIDFFHMDALSAAVPMKVDVDLPLTLMASVLNRMLALRVKHGFEAAKARTIFAKIVQGCATVTITDQDIIVKLGRRAHHPYLMAAGYAQAQEPLPWLHNKVQRLSFA